MLAVLGIPSYVRNELKQQNKLSIGSLFYFYMSSSQVKENVMEKLRDGGTLLEERRHRPRLPLSANIFFNKFPLSATDDLYLIKLGFFLFMEYFILC